MRGERTPREVDNAPGLGRIDTRIGRHSDFLASMISRLPDGGTAGLLTRDETDPSIALLDAWASACEILSFYTERLANESYLGTAAERGSLIELGRLIGYRPSPGAAAETLLAFSFDRPAAIPAAMSADPGLLPAVLPAEVTVPVGLRVRSIPGPGEQPQVFETVGEVTGRPEWNALPAVTTVRFWPVFGRRSCWFRGAGLTVKAGEAVLFASDDLINDGWDLRIITDVDRDVDGERTLVTWDRGLGSYVPPNNPADVPQPLVMHERIPVHGYNAPDWKTLPAVTRAGIPGGVIPGPAGGDPGEWPGFTSLTQTADGLQVDLDGSHPEVGRGDWVVVSQEGVHSSFYRELYRVTERSELSVSSFAVPGKVTRLTLDGEFHAFGTPRQVTVFAGGMPVDIVEAPDSTSLTGGTIVVEGDARDMEGGRRLLISGTSNTGAAAAESAVLASATALAPVDGVPRTSLLLTTSLTTAYRRAGLSVFGNVAPATHGETVHQILGDGDGTRAFRTFALAQSPVTYVVAPTGTGTASTVRVTVDDIEWTQALTLHGQQPGERRYALDTAPVGTPVVRFGPEAPPRTGVQNVRADYRIGLGTAGNVRAQQLSILADRPLGVKAATNPLPAGGGVDPADADSIRVSAPLRTLTLARAVSLRDYADFAIAFTGIGNADARVLPLRSGRTIVVSVCGPEGVEADPVTIANLAMSFAALGDPAAVVRVVPAQHSYLRLALKLVPSAGCDGVAVALAVRTALATRFDAAARSLGDSVHESQIVSAAVGVRGAAAIDLDRLYPLGAAPQLFPRVVPAPAHVGPDGQPVGSTLLSLDVENGRDPFDWLQVVSS